MKLPGTPPTLAAYLADVEQLIANPKTHLYIDSSFLIWALKLGQKSIGEVALFLERSLPGRTHVPLWTAHEFQHHLVKSTAADQAKKAVEDLEGMGKRLYPELAPALSEASDLPHRNSSQLRLAARDAFIELNSIAKILQTWMKETSEGSRDELVKFINAHCLKSDVVFDYLKTLDVLATNRFDSRVPPGFQDRGKKQRAKGMEDKTPEPSNFAGDLIFWREILDHSQKQNRFWRKIENIIVLTDDGKNDWVVGGGEAARPAGSLFSDISTNWNPLPIAHPMLQFEALSQSRVQRVVLINRKLLGALFHTQNVAPSYVNAAFNTALPNDRQIKKSTSNKGVKSRQGDSSANAAASPQARASADESLKVKLPDTASVLDKLVINTLNWLDVVRQELTLTSIPVAEDGGVDIGKLFAAISASGKTVLAGYLGRALMNDAEAGDSLAANKIQDTLSSVTTPDLTLVAWFYAGVLVEKYVLPDCSPRGLPGSILLEQIANHESSPFAKPGIETVLKFIGENQFPLYKPNPEGKKLGIKIGSISAAGGTQKLRAIFVDELNVHDRATYEDDNLLWKLLKLESQDGNYKAKSSDIASATCRFFGIPPNRIELFLVDQELTFSPQDGFVSPDQL